MDIDLSDLNLKKHIDVFSGMENKHSFSISDDTDVHILFFKRKDKYVGIRTGEKADFKSRAQFIVDSYLIEKIRAHIKTELVLENLTAVDCSDKELSNVFSCAEKIKEHMPCIGDVERAHTIVNSSDLNWVFLEEASKYHSLFWNESESKLFSRCA